MVVSAERLVRKSARVLAGGLDRRRLLIVGNDVGYFFSHRISLARDAVTAGYEVHVALPLNREVLPSELNISFHDIHLVRGSMNPFVDVRTLWSLIMLYRQVAPAIVHHFTIKPVLYGGIASRLTRVPRVVNSFTGLGTIFASNRRDFAVMRRVIVALLRFGCLSGNVLNIFQNPDDRERLIRLQICRSTGSSVILGSGVDVSLFVPSPEPAGVPIVAFPSRLLWDKGIGEFVEAARQIHSQGRAARFVLIGKTDPNPTSVPEKVVKKWVAEGVVEWWGYQRDMPAQFRKAHIICLPSHHEGLPKVLAEAASAGRPIVTTDIPGCREVVKHGENGLLVPPGNSRALAAAILELMDRPKERRDMGLKGRERAVRLFASDKVGKEILQLYESVPT